METGTGELDDSGRFGPVARRRHLQDVTYSTERYVDVLRTYSGHRALSPTARHGLLEFVRDLIEGRYEGSVTKRYLHELITAERTARADLP